MKLKTTFHLLTLVATLAFGPLENRHLWFGDAPEQQYGELHFASEEHRHWYLTKNSGSKPVQLAGDAEAWQTSRTIDGQSSIAWHRSTTVFPRSIGLLIRDTKSSQDTQGKIFIDGKMPVQAPTLSVATVRESQRSFALLLILGTLAVILTYQVNDFAWECAPRPWPKALRDESSSPQ